MQTNLTKMSEIQGHITLLQALWTTIRQADVDANIAAKSAELGKVVIESHGYTVAQYWDSLGIFRQGDAMPIKHIKIEEINGDAPLLNFAKTSLLFYISFMTELQQDFNKQPESLAKADVYYIDDIKTETSTAAEPNVDLLKLRDEFLDALQPGAEAIIAGNDGIAYVKVDAVIGNRRFKAQVTDVNETYEAVINPDVVLGIQSNHPTASKVVGFSKTYIIFQPEHWAIKGRL